MIESSENDKNLVSDPILASLAQIWAPKKIFLWILPLLDVRHRGMQFLGKQMNQIWENGKKPSFGPDFGPFGPQNFFSRILSLLDIRHCCELLLYVITRKSNEPNLSKWQET